MLSLLFYFFGGKKVTGVSWQFSSVVDGDTVAFIDKKAPRKIQRISVRIIGIDTPESTFRAKSEAEKKHGIAAKKFAFEQIRKSRTLHVTIFGWDKYGGRVLGSIKINGKDLAEMMINEGYAVKYDGGKKPDWAKLIKKGRAKKRGWFARLMKKIFG